MTSIGSPGRPERGDLTELVEQLDDVSTMVVQRAEQVVDSVRGTPSPARTASASAAAAPSRWGGRRSPSSSRSASSRRCRSAGQSGARAAPPEPRSSPTSGAFDPRDHERCAAADVGDRRVQRRIVGIELAGGGAARATSHSRSTYPYIPSAGSHSIDGAAYRHKQRRHCTCGVPAQRAWRTSTEGWSNGNSGRSRSRTARARGARSPSAVLDAGAIDARRRPSISSRRLGR